MTCVWVSLYLCARVRASVLLRVRQLPAEMRDGADGECCSTLAARQSPVYYSNPFALVIVLLKTCCVYPRDPQLAVHRLR